VAVLPPSVIESIPWQPSYVLQRGNLKPLKVVPESVDSERDITLKLRTRRRLGKN
jgi:hypothetical protein